jgi:hypothetical protein
MAKKRTLDDLTRVQRMYYDNGWTVRFDKKTGMPEIIWPCTFAEVMATSIKDKPLRTITQRVKLQYVPNPKFGWQMPKVEFDDSDLAIYWLNNLRKNTDHTEAVIEDYMKTLQYEQENEANWLPCVTPPEYVPTDSGWLLVTTDHSGIEWGVKLLVEGDKYGRDNCLTHNGRNHLDEVDPLVEFYDRQHAGADIPEGQFVSRYYLSNLIEADRFDNVKERWSRGLNLDGGVEAWTVSGTLYSAVMERIVEHLELTRMEDGK